MLTVNVINEHTYKCLDRDYNNEFSDFFAIYLDRLGYIAPCVNSL